MKNLLRILSVEDSEDDALLELLQIKKGGYDYYHERVETAELFKIALNTKTWDIILSDYKMPHFNGIEALKLLKESEIDIPFILISGTIGEEVAVEAMKAGAHDYIMKHNMKRLLPAVERELSEAKSRAERRLFEKKQKQAEKSLRESEERYRLIAENTADTITVLDLDLNIVYISPSVQKLRGYTVEESLSQSIGSFLTPESLKKVKKVLGEQLELEIKNTSDPSRTVLIELEQIHKNGSIIQVEISISFIRNENFKPIRILAVARNITKRKQAEEKLKVLSHAVEQSPVMIIITNTEGTIEYINPMFEEVTGYSPTEVINNKPSIIKSDKTPNKTYQDIWNTIKSHNIWHGELINKKRNGKLYWSKISISPITDNEGKINHFVSIQEDITQKKKIEEELITAKEKAEESDRLKTAFIQNMSHEIRTPMNAIIGFSELMVSSYKDEENIVEYAKIIENSCSDLLEIINGILNIAQIESGQSSINIDECNLNNVFRELTLFFDEHKNQLGKQNIKLSLQCFSESSDVIIKTDAPKLKQILNNLISNAFKFTNIGKIEGGCKFDENQNLVFFISDTGIGIPLDKQKVIFERFIKLNQNRDRFLEGTGLGLAIVTELIHLLGGRIWLKSEPNKGSTFYFSIPCEIVKK